MLTTQVADQIQAQFIRLGVDAGSDPCSGLSVEMADSLVKIYDDYADGLYDGAVLAHLQTLAPSDVSLDSEANNNIWQVIKAFEV